MAHFSSHSMLPLQFCYRLYACLLLLAFFGAFSIFAVALMTLYGVGGVELVFTICFVAFHALLRLFMPPWNPARVGGAVGPSPYSSFYGGGVKIDHDDHPKNLAIDRYQYNEEDSDDVDDGDKVQKEIDEDKAEKEGEERQKEEIEATVALLPKKTAETEQHLEKDGEKGGADDDDCKEICYTHADDKSFTDDGDNTLITYCRPVSSTTTKTTTNNAAPPPKIDKRSNSKVMIKKLPIKKKKANKKKTPCCPICLHTFEVGDDISKGRVCGHFFHTDCLEPWLAKKTNCPYCRQNLEEQIPMKGNVRKSGAWGIFDGIFDSMYA